MLQKTDTVRSILSHLSKFTLSIILTANFLFVQYLLWNGKIAVSKGILLGFNELFGTTRVTLSENYCNAYYLMTFPFVLILYCIFVMTGKERSHIDSVGSHWRWMCTGSVIFLSVIFYAVSFSAQSGKAVLALALLLLLPLGFVYVPSLIYNWRKIFTRLEIRKSLARYGLCMTLSILIAIVYGLALGLLKTYGGNTEIISSLYVGFSTESGILASIILAPVVEEIAFRGLIFRGFRCSVSLLLAVILSSVCFGIWHRNLAQFCGTVPMGVILALLYYQTGKLRYAILCHSLSNLVMAMATCPKGPLAAFPALQSLGRKIMRLSVLENIVLLLLVISIIVLLLWKIAPRCRSRI